MFDAHIFHFSLELVFYCHACQNRRLLNLATCWRAAQLLKCCNPLHMTASHGLKTTQLPDTAQGVNNACHFLHRPRRENYISHYGYWQRHKKHMWDGGELESGLPSDTAVISRYKSRREENVEQNRRLLLLLLLGLQRSEWRRNFNSAPSSPT